MPFFEKKSQKQKMRDCKLKIGKNKVDNRFFTIETFVEHRKRRTKHQKGIKKAALFRTAFVLRNSRLELLTPTMST